MRVEKYPIRIIEGNSFTLSIELQQIAWGHGTGTTSEFVPLESDRIRVWLVSKAGERIEAFNAVVSANELLISFDEGICKGLYDIEIFVYRANGTRLHCRLEKRIHIVPTTDKMGIEADTIQLTGAVLLVIDGVSLQWDDTPTIGSGAVVTSNGIAEAFNNFIGNDREYNSQENTKGYVILRNDKTLAEQLTQANTIYEVRYNFDLNGDTLTIPEGCVLKFNGGKFLNGVIEFTDTFIKDNGQQCFEDVVLTGSILNNELDVHIVGCYQDDDKIDCASIFRSYLMGIDTTWCFSAGVYYWSGLFVNKDNFRIKGEESSGLFSATKFKNFYRNQSYIIKLGGEANSMNISGSTGRITAPFIKDIRFITTPDYEPTQLSNTNTDATHNHALLIIDKVERGYFAIGGTQIYNTPLVSLGYIYECYFEYINMYGNRGDSSLPIICINNKHNTQPISATIINRVQVEAFIGPIISSVKSIALEFFINEMTVEGSRQWGGDNISNVTKYTNIPNYNSYKFIPLFELSGGQNRINIGTISFNSINEKWENSLDGDGSTVTQSLVNIPSGNNVLRIYRLFNSGSSHYLLSEGTPSITLYQNKVFIYQSNVVHDFFISKNYINIYNKDIEEKIVLLKTNYKYDKNNLCNICKPTFITNVGDDMDVKYVDYDKVCIISRSNQPHLINSTGLKVMDDAKYISFLYSTSPNAGIKFNIEYYNDNNTLVSTSDDYTFNVASNKEKRIVLPIDKNVSFTYFKIKDTLNGSSLSYGRNIWDVIVLDNDSYNALFTARPTYPASGAVYFDSTINKVLYWTGEEWVDATGTVIQ